jgi:cytochrome d ubiquinol oxidase subunit I
MFKFARQGPSSLHTGRYFHEHDKHHGDVGAGPAPTTAPAQRRED